MPNVIQRGLRWLTGYKAIERDIENAFNRAFYQYVGGQGAQYDYKDKTYLTEGYGRNPDVYSIITQQYKKLISVPFAVRKVINQKAFSSLQQLEYATKGNRSIQQDIRYKDLAHQSFDEEEMDFPLEQPNPVQTWSDIFALYEVFMQTTGNFYLYLVRPQAGRNKGVPMQVYVLPSHLIEIKVRPDAHFMIDDNPIDYYILRQGEQTIAFDTDDIIHIKLPNPFFNFNGHHLYGLSPLHVALLNIESSNEALKNNVKTMKNSGVFGILTGRDKVLTKEQGEQTRQRLRQMDSDTGRLSRIAAFSAPLDFIRLNLNTNELRPFEYLLYDRKTLCNILGWDDLLLNNHQASTFDNLHQAQKMVVINHVIPRLILLQEALNKQFIPLFKGYENAHIDFDYTELPEMQKDMKMMVEWMDIAPLTPNEKRIALNYPEIEEEGMDEVWVDAGKRRIDEAGLSDWELDKAFGDG